MQIASVANQESTEPHTLATRFQNVIGQAKST